MDFEQWLRNLVGSGPWKCRCGKPVQHPGVCDRCASLDDRRRAEELVAASLETIPIRFRCCTYTGDELGKRVASDHIRDSRMLIVDQLINEAIDGAVLIGPKGAGKTSLACAMLHELADKRAKVAWKACYARALDLGACRRDARLGMRPQLIEDATSASLLLLDDLGQEADVGPLREVIHARHDDCKPTIVTTCWGQDTLLAKYGGGIDRRLFERSAILLMGGAQ